MFVLWVMKMVYYKIVPHLIVYRVLILENAFRQSAVGAGCFRSRAVVSPRSVSIHTF